MHSLPDDISNTLQHQDLHLQKPLLHHALKITSLQYHIHERTASFCSLVVPDLGICRVDVLGEGHPLLLRADHAGDGHVLGEVELGDALKALLEVGLHAQWILGLRQDLQQLIVGQEEEPKEKATVLG